MAHPYYNVERSDGENAIHRRMEHAHPRLGRDRSDRQSADARDRHGEAAA